MQAVDRDTFLKYTGKVPYTTKYVRHGMEYRDAAGDLLARRTMHPIGVVTYFIYEKAPRKVAPKPAIAAKAEKGKSSKKGAK